MFSARSGDRESRCEWANFRRRAEANRKQAETDQHHGGARAENETDDHFKCVRETGSTRGRAGTEYRDADTESLG